MHVNIPTAAGAVPGAGILVGEDAPTLEARINALLAAQLVTTCLADASIGGVEGGRLFLVNLTLQLLGPDNASSPAANLLTARIFRGESFQAIEAARVFAYAQAPFLFLSPLYLDKIAHSSNGREFWNLQIFGLPRG